MLSFILSNSVKYLMPLLLIFSFFLFLRGHNHPGGGFVGGLTAAAAYALFTIANGVEDAKKLLGFDSFYLIAAGLASALLSGLIGVFYGKNFLTGMWWFTEIPVIGKIGSPLLFDFGVYLLVLGIMIKIVFTLAEEDQA